MSDKTWTEKAGGRKAAAFYACLISLMFLMFAGANVMIKPKQLEAKAQAKADNSPDPKPKDSMEKP